MLSDERIEELWVDIHKGKFMHAGFNTFARAIEAAVLPEGLVAVPKEPTLAMLDCLRSGITSNLEKRYQAMLAAAPKPAQASPIDLTPRGDAQAMTALAAEVRRLRECWNDAQKCAATAADSERLEWLMRNVSGKEFRRLGVTYGGNCGRDRIDAAMKPNNG